VFVVTVDVIIRFYTLSIERSGFDLILEPETKAIEFASISQNLELIVIRYVLFL